MQNGQSRFVVNIVPLQNVVSNASGLDATAELSNSVANIQKMVNFEQKRINTNFLGSYTTGASIQVVSPLNLCNVGITSNNTPILGSGTSGTSGTSVSTLASPSASTFIRLYDASLPQSPAVSMGIGGHQVFQIGGTGNGLYYDTLHSANEFRISSMTFAADLGQFSTVAVGGTCYATQFVTLSDREAKYNIQALTDIRGIVQSLQSLQTYSFSYLGSQKTEIGLLAQELEGVFPECVDLVNGSKCINYDSMVALLLAAVRSLSSRVDQLESGFRV
jgi:hypothetical protein